MTGPRVSVVMPVWNAEPEHLREAVASLLAQWFVEFELIVVEDPSPREAGAVLAEFADDRVRHVRNETRGSMSAARNQGLALARADLVAMFDSDDICEPARLGTQRAFLDGHPDVVVCGTQLQIIDPDGKRKGWREYPTEHDDIVAAMRSYNPIAHPSVMLRRDAVVAAGGYCEAPERVCDDYELWSRLARSGKRFANLDAVLVRYRLHAGATKSRQLRATLADTLWIKRTYWRDRLGLRGRARMCAERCLMWLPPKLVLRLFERSQIRRA